MQTSRLVCLPVLTLLSSILVTTAGCSRDSGEQLDTDRVQPAPPSALTGPFVPIYRQVSGTTIQHRRLALSTASAAGQGAPAMTQDFYLAINKNELGNKWFLSAYLSQAAPRGPDSGAAVSLGTR